MTSGKDQELYQSYLEKLVEEDGDEVENEVHNLESTVDGNGDKDVENRGAIIMDAYGNYYYQSSEKTVKIEPLMKVSEVPGIKVTSVVFPSNKQNNSVNTTNCDPISKSKSKVTCSKKIKQETDSNTVNETTELEVCNQDEVYEFVENEQEVETPSEANASDYKSKGVIKTKKETAAKESSFTCTICSYQTNKKFLLSRHLKTHSDERPYKCSVCERGFKTNAALANHRNIHLGYKPHACSSCDMAFTTSGELVRHVRYRHTHIKPHKCTECDYSSVEMSKLRRHMRCHTGERPYQCPHCTYASPDTFKLKRHLRIHTGEKPYECDICHARFTQSNSLKHHRLIHSVNEKPVFQCHLCPTTCGRKTDLRLHINKLHTYRKNLQCKRCLKEFHDRYTYKMHIKTHQGERCYRCKFCPYASISQRHLESHVFIHLNEKPFVCEICQSSFRQKPLLSRHMKIYHSDNYVRPVQRRKEHKCPDCNKMFAFNGNLIRHLEVHDPTSRMFEEKEKLRLGRMRRVNADGTVTVSPNNSSSKVLNDNEETLYEETEDQYQIDDEELQEEYEETEDYNEDNIQYVYDEYEVIENEEHNEEEQDEQQLEDKIDKSQTKDVKPEKMHSVKAEEINNSDIMSLEVQDDQGFMIIEVLPGDDDDENEEENNQVTVQRVESQESKSDIVHKKDNTSTVKGSPKDLQPLISDYFGFEVNADEDDEETKGGIKLLEIIEDE